MENFVNQLQELTKNIKEQQEKENQLKQQQANERSIQDSKKFFDKYFSKWLIELANQGLSYLLCRLEFDSKNQFCRIVFHEATRPNSRKEFGVVIFNAVPPYYCFDINDFLNIINNQNFSQVLYQQDKLNPSDYHCLINWGAEMYKFTQEIEEEQQTEKKKPLKQSKFLRDIANLDNKDCQNNTERQKMSAGLRYDILKRDGYKCKICGRGAEDGVKLHVDHIVPIVKGGKTVPENLQTLCQDCNLGKGIKDF